MTKHKSLKINTTTLQLITDCSKEIISDLPDLHDWYDHYFETQHERIAYDYEMLKEYVSPQSMIVEIGPTPFLLTLPLVKTGYQVDGIDIGPERFQKLIDKYSLNIHKCDIEREKLPLPDNHCDVVLLNEVFEHLRINLIFTMRELFRILKPDGYLFLSTRNVHSWVGINNFLFQKIVQSGSTDIYREYSKLDSLGHMGHVREYTSKEVGNFLLNIGFNIENVFYRGSYEAPVAKLMTMLNHRLRPYFSIVARKPCCEQ